MLCLIPELCCLTGLTDQLRSDFRVMKELSTHTRVTPTERVFNLNDFLEKIKMNPQAYHHLKVWGLELDEYGLADIDARVLERERIYVGNNETFSAGDQCDWSRDISRKPVLNAVNLSNWILIFTKTKAKEAENFYEAMRKCSRLFGIRLQEPEAIEIGDDKSETYIRELKKSIQSHTQMVVVIFPTSRDDRYAAIKRLCCIEIPVASQVIIAKTIGDERKLGSVAQKILLQINCKLGGELWKLQIPIPKLMIIGIDTYHQTSRQFKSLAGLVASMNNEQTKWFSKVSFQMTGQELVDSMKVAFTQALHKYQDLNGFLPDRIIIYRDGVGDSQLSYVITHEIEQFKTCFMQNYKPKLSMIVVQKRINQRLFLKQTSSSSKEPFVNPEPGSIVDNKITRHDQYDFFLVSQHVKQGTVTPTHYIVAYDDSSIKPDHMQRLTYKMTHMYYNWPGTIRVPAPCQVRFFRT
jgi:aubergine